MIVNKKAMIKNIFQNHKIIIPISFDDLDQSEITQSLLMSLVVAIKTCQAA